MSFRRQRLCFFSRDRTQTEGEEEQRSQKKINRYGKTRRDREKKQKKRNAHNARAAALQLGTTQRKVKKKKDNGKMGGSGTRRDGMGWDGMGMQDRVRETPFPDAFWVDHELCACIWEVWEVCMEDLFVLHPEGTILVSCPRTFMQVCIASVAHLLSCSRTLMLCTSRMG